MDDFNIKNLTKKELQQSLTPLSEEEFFSGVKKILDTKFKQKEISGERYNHIVDKLIQAVDEYNVFDFDEFTEQVSKNIDELKELPEKVNQLQSKHLETLVRSIIDACMIKGGVELLEKIFAANADENEIELRTLDLIDHKLVMSVLEDFLDSVV